MYKISTRLDYGIIILRTLAASYGKGPVSLQTIATINNLPYQYLVRIIRPLTKASLVASQEGKCGGYILALKPSAISLYEIIRILEPYKSLTRCTAKEHASCARKHTCPMASWWMKFNHKMETILKKIKLSDVL